MARRGPTTKNNNPKSHTEQIEEKQLDKTRHYTTLLERSKRDDTQQDKTLQDRPKKQGMAKHDNTRPNQSGQRASTRNHNPRSLNQAEPPQEPQPEISHPSNYNQK